MKKILLLVILLPNLLYAQNGFKIPDFKIDSATKEVTYSEIVQVPGVTKDILYVRAKEWVAINFKSAQNVIQMDDKEAGKLIVKGLSSQYADKLGGISFKIYFTLSFTIKEAKYRVVLNSFEIEHQEVPAILPTPEPCNYYINLVQGFNKTAKRNFDDKNKKNDDDDDGFSFFMTKRKRIQVDATMLNNLDGFATAQLSIIKKDLSVVKKDDF